MTPPQTLIGFCGANGRKMGTGHLGSDRRCPRCNKLFKKGSDNGTWTTHLKGCHVRADGSELI